MNVRRMLPRRGLLLVIAGSGALALTAPALSGTSTTTGTPGSLGSTYFLNANSSGGALQGEIASKPNTSILVPYGVLGEYDPSPQPSATFGAGVIGISSDGYGVGAESFGEAAVYALNGGSGDGLEALNLGSAAAGNGYAADVSSSHGIALGVYSPANHGSLIESNANGKAAVYAANFAAGTPFSAALVGRSGGYGLYADGAIGVMTFGSQSALTAKLGGEATTTTAATGTGYAIDAYTQYAGGGEALLGSGTGEGVVAMGLSGSAAHPALVADGLTTGTDLIAGEETRGAAAGTSFIVQGASADRSGVVDTSSANSDVQVQGDIYLTGQIYANCTAFPAAKSTSCNEYLPPTNAPGPQSSDLMEDAGEARLVNGSAHVRLNPSFANAFSAAQPYMVFVTPNGESRGLFVVAKTREGFDVRENAAGRSTMIFDYRILAHRTSVGRVAAGDALSHSASVRPYIVRHSETAGAFAVPPRPGIKLSKARLLEAKR